MRNWNCKKKSLRASGRNRFYLTYEELKRVPDDPILYVKQDFILPMRNWNMNLQFFGSMTVKDFILPMRNWNFANSHFKLDREKDFILPMRNWNNLQRQFLYQTFPKDFILPMRNWNLAALCPGIDRIPAILSYLWGIETHDNWFHRRKRNPILSYLWGIETPVEPAAHNPVFKILSYLWGIETANTTSQISMIQPILSYLWGIETHPEMLRRDWSQRFYLTYEELKLFL